MAYFYCDYRDQHESTESNIIASLLRQLAVQLAEMPTCLIELYEKHKIERSLPPASEMSGALRQICSDFEKSFICIDAFDEIVAPIERTSILRLLSSLRSCTTRLYITSRAPNELNNVNSAEIRIVAHTGDIRAFLHQTLEPECAVSELLDETLREEILNVLSERACGM